VSCIQVSSAGSDTLVPATVSKLDGKTFSTELETALYSPTTSKSDLSYYYCSTGVAGQYSYAVSINPVSLGLASSGGTIGVNAQVMSPCASAANYISGDGYVSQCQ
jgi:hypothetical protein